MKWHVLWKTANGTGAGTSYDTRERAIEGALDLIRKGHDVLHIKEDEEVRLTRAELDRLLHR